MADKKITQLTATTAPVSTDLVELAVDPSGTPFSRKCTLADFTKGLSAATTTAKGTVELATSGENAADVVVQGNDSRLSDARTPTAHKATHEVGGSDLLTGTLDANARVAVRKNTGAVVGTRRQMNLIEGANVTLTVADDAAGEEVDITIAATGASGYGTVQEEGTSLTQRATMNFIGGGVTAADNVGNTRTDVTVTRTGVYRELWVDAGAMVPRTTTGAAAATVESTTNKVMNDVLDFDQTTEEFAQFRVSMPDAWDRGTIKARVYWTAASGTGGVTWGLRGTTYRDDDAIDVAFGTEVNVSDTLIAADDVHITAATAAITIGGTHALHNLIIMQIARKVSDAGDTLTADARLLGVKLQYLELTTEPVTW